jgi:hypothetical protein
MGIIKVTEYRRNGVINLLPQCRIMLASICLFAAGHLCGPEVYADGDHSHQSDTASGERDNFSVSPPSASSDQSSANYGKDKHYLPGEEVVTPTGQRLKVWSTKGPVPVSRAPEPFEDREKSTLSNIPIVVEVDPRRPSGNRGD